MGSLLLERLRSWIGETAYWEKWTISSAVLGIIGGVAALAFYLAVESVESLYSMGKNLMGDTLGLLGGPLLFALLATGSYYLPYLTAREAVGAGIEETLRSYHYRAGYISPLAAPVKLASSAMFIGGGGSAGLQGPGVLIGGSLAGLYARIMGMNMEDRRAAIVVGMSAVLSAIYRAPIGSAIFAGEVLYKRDMEAKYLYPAIIASVVAYAITYPFLGGSAGLPEVYVDVGYLYSLGGLAVCVGVGVLVSLPAILYVSTYRASVRLRERLGSWAPIVLLGASITVGVMLIYVPEASGPGIDKLPKLIGTESPDVFLLALVAVVKIAATTIMVGLGASGGLFAPALFIGALWGLLFYNMASISGLEPGVYAYVAMAAFLGSVTKTPIASSIMVGELSGDYVLIAPALLSSMIAYSLLYPVSLYVSQIDHRPPEETLEIEDVMEALNERGARITVRARDLAEPRIAVVSTSSSVLEALRAFSQRSVIAVAVIGQGKILGVIDNYNIDIVAEEAMKNPERLIGELRLGEPPIVGADNGLDKIIESMVAHDKDYAIVVDNGRIIGIVTLESLRSLLASYVVELI